MQFLGIVSYCSHRCKSISIWRIRVQEGEDIVSVTGNVIQRLKPGQRRALTVTSYVQLQEYPRE